MSNEKRVRLACGATGIDIGAGWGLYVSAQDNDLGIDRIKPDEVPATRPLPVPTAAELNAARIAVMAATVLNRNVVIRGLQAERDKYVEDTVSWRCFNDAMTIAREVR